MGEDDNVRVHVHLCLLLQAHVLQVYHPAMSSNKLAHMRLQVSAVLTARRRCWQYT